MMQKSVNDCSCCWRILCVAWLDLHGLEMLQTNILQSLSASANQDGVCPCLFMLPQIAVWDPDQQQAAIEDQQGGTGSPQQRNSMDLHDQINSRYHCQPLCHGLAKSADVTVSFISVCYVLCKSFSFIPSLNE